MPLPGQGDGSEDRPVADSEIEEPVFWSAPPESNEVPVQDEIPEEFRKPEFVEGFASFDPVLDRRGKQDAKPEPLRAEDGTILPEFDRRCRDDFEGLAFIGSLSKSFRWLGHSFTIRTLPVDALLAVAEITKDYQETMGAGLAYRTALAALCVISVDGQDLPLPIESSDNSYAWAYQRFDYAKAKWFQFTVDAIMAEYTELEVRTQDVVIAMGKALGPTGSTTG